MFGIVILGQWQPAGVDYAGVERIFFDADLHNASAWLCRGYGGLRVAFGMQIMHGMHNGGVQGFGFQVQSWDGCREGFSVAIGASVRPRLRATWATLW